MRKFDSSSPDKELDNRASERYAGIMNQETVLKIETPFVSVVDDYHEFDYWLGIFRKAQEQGGIPVLDLTYTELGLAGRDFVAIFHTKDIDPGLLDSFRCKIVNEYGVDV